MVQMMESQCEYFMYFPAVPITDLSDPARYRTLPRRSHLYLGETVRFLLVLRCRDGGATPTEHGPGKGGGWYGAHRLLMKGRRFIYLPLLPFLYRGVSVYNICMKYSGDLLWRLALCCDYSPKNNQIQNHNKASSIYSSDYNKRQCDVLPV